jgi:hypothetical protein
VRTRQNALEMKATSLYPQSHALVGDERRPKNAAIGNLNNLTNIPLQPSRKNTELPARQFRETGRTGKN